MNFDVVKASQGFSKWEGRAGAHSLKFEVVASGSEQLDIGDEYILIGSGYHRLKGQDRRMVLATVSVTSDPTYLDHIKGERPICGWGSFHKERDDMLDPTPPLLDFNVIVEPEIFEAMSRTQIDEPGSATLGLGIEGLEFGREPDGSHQVWKLDDDSDCGLANRRRITHFYFAVDTFSTTEGAIQEADDRRTNALLAESPNPDDRKLAELNRPAVDDRVPNMLGQCRWLLLALLVVAAISLVACGQAKDDCLDLPVYPPAGITDLKQEVFACVERNAALFAKGTDTPEAISKAVTVKCQPTIMRYVEQEAKDAGEQPQYTPALNAWREHALPVIAEARARGCYS
jgi:hypothetical protein